MQPSPESTPAPLPIGRSGLLEAQGLAVGGDHAVLVRHGGVDRRDRALLTTDKLPDGERLVITPLDDEVEVRVDGDALAVWLGAGSLAQLPANQRPMPANVPLWASLIGGAMLVLVLLLAVIGSMVAWTYLVSLFR